MSDDTNDADIDYGAEDLEEVETMLRQLDDDDLHPTPPPPALWSGIAQAITTTAPVAEAQHRFRLPPWLLAAAAVLVVATSGALVLARGDGDDEELVSTAVLVHDPVEFDARGVESSATAHLVERDGQFEIELTDADLPTVTGDDLELWLIEPDAAGNPVDVKPVAVIEGSAPITYRVPEGLDPRTHYVVDISIEPRDGNAAHSGQSILRGPFERS